jgi:hypothetical protein
MIPLEPMGFGRAASMDRAAAAPVGLAWYFMSF